MHVNLISRLFHLQDKYQKMYENPSTSVPVFSADPGYTILAKF